VRLYFPRVAAPEPASASAGAIAPVAEGGKGETILVVEDDRTVLEMAADSLRDAGYVVEGVADGAAALQTLKTGRRIDVMFSDVVMPGGLNGIDLACEARKILPDLKILLTSGYAAGALNGQASLPPGVEILAKPYRQEELVRELRRMLDA
jgi:CheY-like chemotaxis protein